MPSSILFTKQLRRFACWSWSLGLALTALDVLYIPIFQWRASVGYIFFTLAAFLVAWAEKREFSTRIFLYRLHDVAIYSPWKYLLLYFLWISIFSPFTNAPFTSLLFATNGWLSLGAVGLMAQFIFCERGEHGVLLLPDRLKIPFRFYSAAVFLLMSNTLLHLFYPDLSVPMLIKDQVNFFLFFLVGLPFLLWDFLKDGRRMMWRSWSGFVLILGSVTSILIGRMIFQVSLLFCFGAILLLFVYKKIRFANALKLSFGGVAIFTLVLYLLRSLLLSENSWMLELEHARSAMEEYMKSPFLHAVDILVQSKYLGMGLGLSDLRGVWGRVLAEAGIVGFLLYAAFFVSVLKNSYEVRRSARVVVSNVSVVSLGIFLLIVSHYVENPYGAYVWVWYSIWALFASTPKKKNY